VSSSTKQRQIDSQGQDIENHKQLPTGQTKRVIRKTKREGVRQFSVHLRETIHRDAKIALLIQGSKQDFSGLVEQLLVEFLSKQKFQLRSSSGPAQDTL
jgi:hypothetical protein